MFFPGGDLGSLAVHGTITDLAMSGARPLHLSAGLIIEEGLPVESLNLRSHMHWDHEPRMRQSASPSPRGRGPGKESGYTLTARGLANAGSF